MPVISLPLTLLQYWWALALGVCDLAVVGVVMLMLSVFLETPALPGTAKVWAAALFLGAIQGLVIQSMVTGALEEMRTPAVAVLDLYLQGLHAAS